MKKIMISVAIVLGMLGVCSAESFIVEEVPQKTRPDHQVRQEILDLLGKVAELESESIKTKAEVQKETFVHLRSYVEGDKGSFLSRASRKDLQRIVQTLRKEVSSLNATIAADKRLLEMVKKPLSV